MEFGLLSNLVDHNQAYAGRGTQGLEVLVSLTWKILQVVQSTRSGVLASELENPHLPELT